ncbi:APC family permease [Tenuibacillus multivorans]|uniref:Amino acid transporter n=1 Tax=Tenuibacillus multivorans TaxID=237069 RepID=A0A1H0G5W3_9BACI|nr:APC family permease [Tenuibacillus multivorans]GEL78815.1 amino acid permease [Tenuibacillus multivorans]SDO02224.1 Amino acid transporter [Tenuibacillus multivorans]
MSSGNRDFTRKKLSKTLKPHWVWAIALGSSIGWGSFVLPADWMQGVGPMGVILGLTIGAALMAIIAISYGVLIKNYPVSGGEFAYAFLSLNRVHAYISGWFLTLGYICIVAVNATAFALMLKFVFPDFIENMKMYEVAGWDVYFTEVIFVTLIVGVFTWLNIKGSGLSGRMQFFFCLVLLLGVFTLTGLMTTNEATSFSNMTPAFDPGTTPIAAILTIVAIAPFAYVGFDNVPQAAEEFKFSAKKALTLIMLALVFGALIYSLMIVTTAVATPWQQTSSAGALWGTGDVVTEVLGTGGMVILVIALSMGIFTGLNGFLISASRVLFAMARGKVLPESFARLHPKHNTPYFAIIFAASVAVIAPFFGRNVLGWVVDMSSVGVSIAYFYTCFTAFKMLKWSENDPKYDNTLHIVSPGKKVVAVLGMLSSVGFLGLLLIPGSPAVLGMESFIALVVWVVLGFIFYMVRRRELQSYDREDLAYLILGKKKFKLGEENN